MSAINRPMPDAASLQLPAGSLWRKLDKIGFILGALGLAAAFGMGMGSDEAKVQLFHSYLVSYLYWVSIALGCLFFVIVQFATRAGWSVTVRRMAENGMMTLPFFALLFLPIVAGMTMQIHGHHGDAYLLYDHWLHPHDEAVKVKVGYLNRTFFMIRQAIYFVIWCGLALMFFRRSHAQDQTGDLEHTRVMQKWSYAGIPLFGLSITFAAFDWIMSLDPHWFSTMFGVYFFAGSTVSMFAFLALVALLGIRSGIFKGTVDTEHVHDLGKFTYAFTIFWTYIAFSQYFLIWYSNTPEETEWFALRLHGSWMTAAQVLVLLHFIIPFLLLLPRTVKRNPVAMLIAAVWLLAVHWLDLHWQVIPIVRPEGFSLELSDITTFIGIGGIFLGAFGMMVKKGSVIPLKDPRLKEALTFENF